VKIAHLVPTLHPGGPEIGLSDLAGASREVGIELHVIAIAATSDTTEVSALRRAGVPVDELGLAPWDPRAAVQVAKLLRDRRDVLVHTHLPQADVVGAAAAVRNRIPAVSTLHRIGTEVADRGDRFRRTARIFARQRFMSRTIALSQVQLEWYRGLGGPHTDIVVVPNGVADPGEADQDARARRRRVLEVGEGDVLALYMAPMRREQGHELLLDALEALPDGLPLVVALAGDGPLRPYLESRVDSTVALAERVRFLHRSHHPTELTAAADIALHTSHAGAQPTALIRAMAAGLPAIATRVGGVPELVTPGTGILIPFAAHALTDALVALTEDAGRRAQTGAAAPAHFLPGFEAVGWARRLKGVYESVLARS
jgi:glycosyltransferase involved in cell wall biosynthesis